jgi:hypothetical protein
MRWHEQTISLGCGPPKFHHDKNTEPSIRQHGSDARTNMQGKEKDTYREVKAGTGMNLN